MSKVQLFVDGQCICERTWPDIPRVADGVTLANPERTYTVNQLEWIDSGDTVIARIHLKAPTDPAIT